MWYDMDTVIQVRPLQATRAGMVHGRCGWTSKVSGTSSPFLGLRRKDTGLYMTPSKRWLSLPQMEQRSSSSGTRVSATTCHILTYTNPSYVVGMHPMNHVICDCGVIMGFNVWPKHVFAMYTVVHFLARDNYSWWVPLRNSSLSPKCVEEHHVKINQMHDQMLVQKREGGVGNDTTFMLLDPPDAMFNFSNVLPRRGVIGCH